MTLAGDKNHMSDENLWFQKHIWPNQNLTEKLLYLTHRSQIWIQGRCVFSTKVCGFESVFKRFWTKYHQELQKLKCKQQKLEHVSRFISNWKHGLSSFSSFYIYIQSRSEKIFKKRLCYRLSQIEFESTIQNL